MTAEAPSASRSRRPRGTRQAGYAVAIAVNGIILFVVNNVLAWDVVPWLTDDFTDVLPVLNVSLLASIAANAVYLVFDPPLWRSVSELALLALSIAVAVTTYRVFPFDFASYSFDWELLARWVIGLAIFGMCVGFVAGAVKLLVDLAGGIGHTHMDA
jgi:hypothetical protein